MCSIDSYEKNQKSVNKHKPVNNDTIVYGARLLPSNSIELKLKSFVIIINFVGSWLR